MKRLDDKWKWIARDRDSLLYVFNTKPGKGKIYAVWSIEDGENRDYWEIENKDLFQFVQWKDSEPYNIAELIRGYEWAQLNEKYPPVGEREETEVKRDIE